MTKRAGIAARFVTLVTKRAVVTKRAATGRPWLPVHVPESPYGLCGRKATATVRHTVDQRETVNISTYMCILHYDHITFSVAGRCFTNEIFIAAD